MDITVSARGDNRAALPKSLTITPMTPVRWDATSATFVAPRRGDGRTRNEKWFAASVDGEWTYRRLDDERTTPWEITYLPTGQKAWFGTSARARRATASTLIGDLRREALEAAFGLTPTVEGVRWAAVHMRKQGGDESDAACACGGILVRSGRTRLAHVDACARCHTVGIAGIDSPCEHPHRFCTSPRPVATPAE